MNVSCKWMVLGMSENVKSSLSVVVTTKADVQGVKESELWSQMVEEGMYDEVRFYVLSCPTFSESITANLKVHFNEDAISRVAMPPTLGKYDQVVVDSVLSAGIKDLHMLEAFNVYLNGFESKGDSPLKDIYMDFYSNIEF